MIIAKEKIETYLAKKCMSYCDLSQKAGISRITIQKMVHNKVDTRPMTIGKIAKALEVPVEELIETTADIKDNAKVKFPEPCTTMYNLFKDSQVLNENADENPEK